MERHDDGLLPSSSERGPTVSRHDSGVGGNETLLGLTRSGATSRTASRPSRAWPMPSSRRRPAPIRRNTAAMRLRRSFPASRRRPRPTPPRHLDDQRGGQLARRLRHGARRSDAVGIESGADVGPLRSPPGADGATSITTGSRPPTHQATPSTSPDRRPQRPPPSRRRRLRR